MYDIYNQIISSVFCLIYKFKKNNNTYMENKSVSPYKIKYLTNVSKIINVGKLIKLFFYFSETRKIILMSNIVK